MRKNNALTFGMVLMSVFFLLSGINVKTAAETDLDEYEVQSASNDAEYLDLNEGRAVRDLKIVLEAENAADQIFVVEVKNLSTSECIYVTLSLENAESASVTIADLPVGEVAVSQLDSWSWRYEPMSFVADHADESHVNEVRFVNSCISDQWISDSSELHKNQRRDDS